MNDAKGRQARDHRHRIPLVVQETARRRMRQLPTALDLPRRFIDHSGVHRILKCFTGEKSSVLCTSLCCVSHVHGSELLAQVDGDASRIWIDRPAVAAR